MQQNRINRSSNMLYYWAVITSGGDHGHILYTLHSYITGDTVWRWGLKGQVVPHRQWWASVPDSPLMVTLWWSDRAG